MKKVVRSSVALVVGSFVVAIFGMLLPDTLIAETGMKRSAGKLSRSLGSRRGGSLGADRKGRESSTPTSRQSREPGYRSPDDGGEWETQIESVEEEEQVARQVARESETSGVRNSMDGTDGIDGIDEEEEAEVDYESRTLGRACIYGTRGEVVFRPSGGRCRGDEVKRRSEIGQERDRGAARTRGGRSAPAALRPEAARRDMRKAAVPKKRTRGRCIYGGGDRIIYSPPGVDCRR